MARFCEPTAEQESGWKKWVKSRPKAVRIVAEKFEPWSLYRMKSTGHRVTVASFGEGEDGAVTLTVNVSADFNLVLMERSVFGIDPNDLEPCEIPSPEEMTGAMLSNEQVDDNIDALRVMVRPDLWVMGTDGKARRKDN